MDESIRDPQGRTIGEALRAEKSKPTPLTVDELRPIAHSRVVTVRVADVWPLLAGLERQRDEAVALLREAADEFHKGPLLVLPHRIGAFLRALDGA
jgi:hypothetical protein